MAELESRSPATGEVLGTVPGTGAPGVCAAARAAAVVQPLWAEVPARARARYLRRAAQAVLDEVDRLALLLARETGRPRSEALLAELLPSVSALHALADDGPKALADERLGRPPLLRAGRRAVLVQAPVGVVGIRGRSASPWAEAVLEAAASLLAGNAVLLAPAAPLAGERIAAAFIRAGVPGELIAVVHGPEAHDALRAAPLAPAAGTAPERAAPLAPDADMAPERAAPLARVVDLGDDEAKATMLVLDDAPLESAVAGALWGAFAGAGRHPAAVGRLVVAPGAADALLERLVAGARRLRVGTPEHADTEVGPSAPARRRRDGCTAARVSAGPRSARARCPRPGSPCARYAGTAAEARHRPPNPFHYLGMGATGRSSALNEARRWRDGDPVSGRRTARARAAPARGGRRGRPRRRRPFAR